MKAEASLADLASFYFDHEGCFLLPLEHLTREGMTEALASEIERRRLLRRPSIDLFDAAIRLLFERQGALHQAAPDTHLPPRLANVLVVTEQETTRPFFQPFVDASVILYAADLDPERSSAEHVAFQLLFAERLGQLKRYGRGLLATLPLLLSFDEASIASFVRGAASATRPDADVAKSLAALAGDIRRNVLADGLGLGASPPDGYARIQGTALATERSFATQLGKLAKEAEETAARVATTYLTRQRSRSAAHEEEVCRYLESDKPSVLVLDENGEIIWDPERSADTSAVREALREIGERPAKSLTQDLATVSRVTRDFLRLLADPDALVVPTQSLEEAGGVFVHHTRRLVAYSIAQPGLDVRTEAAPPFHRLLLAARTAHEWGHLAVDGGVVPVPPHKRRQFEEAGRELRALFTRVMRTAPPGAKEGIESELAELEREGTRLEELPLARIEDYRSNLLFSRVIRREELEAYVRVNVRSLLVEPIGILRKLARYAYESQYLWLSKMAAPWTYLVSTTFILEEMVESEIVTEATLRQLLQLVGQLCQSYEVDESKLRSA